LDFALLLVLSAVSRPGSKRCAISAIVRGAVMMMLRMLRFDIRSKETGTSVFRPLLSRTNSYGYA
jgi:hypothetical protein